MDRDGASKALAVAVKTGNINAARILLGKGADPNFRHGVGG